MHAQHTRDTHAAVTTSTCHCRRCAHRNDGLKANEEKGEAPPAAYELIFCNAVTQTHALTHTHTQTRTYTPNFPITLCVNTTIKPGGIVVNTLTPD